MFNTNFLLTTNVKSVDLIIMCTLTIPIFLIYVIYTLIYFLKIDKSLNTNCNKTHGLSRFCLAGIFFLFGLIIFDVNFEFLTAYITQYVDEAYLGADTMKKLNSSIIFKGISVAYKAIPINVLMNFTIICTAIYTSTEGIIASLKTLKVEAGLAIELPEIKRKRLAAMFLLWCYISIICTIYTILIGSETVKFELTNCYISTGLTLVILFLAERAPSLLQDTTQQSKVVKVSNNIVTDYNDSDKTSYIDSEINKLWNVDKFGDKVTEAEIKHINVQNVFNKTENHETNINVETDI